MSNVPKLVEYMTSEKWVDEVNEDNPLGMRGEIARSFAELIKMIWSGRYSYTVPRNFKVSLNQLYPVTHLYFYRFILYNCHISCFS